MKKSKSWIIADSWKKIENTRAMNRMVDDAEYQRLDKEVKSNLRKDKREWANNIAQEAEDAARQGQMKEVYEATRNLCNERPKRVGMVKVAQKSFQHFSRCSVRWVIITTLYQLMLQSWYQKTAQSLVNTLLLFS